MELGIYTPETKMYSRYGKGRTFGEFNLYADRTLVDPMKIEKQFSALENTFGNVARRTRDAVSASTNYIHISEDERVALHKFMFLSSIRLKHVKERYMDASAENDLGLLDIFRVEQAKAGGHMLLQPKQIWLNRLRYILDTPHEDLLHDAEKEDAAPDVNLYRYFWNKYSLQIWIAADEEEFFLSDSFVDFEGDTTGFLAIDREMQLTYFKHEDRINVWMPMSPTSILAFCSSARCRTDPQEAQITSTTGLLAAFTMLDTAPRVDPVQEPASLSGQPHSTDCWRISIAQLSSNSHFIIASYALCHASDTIIFNDKSKLQGALSEVENFIEEREDLWRKHGERWLHDETKQYHERDLYEGLGRLPSITWPRNLADDDQSVTKKDVFNAFILVTTGTTNLNPPRSQYAIRKTDWFQAFIRDLEGCYPAKRAGHLDLVTISFWQFMEFALDEKQFMELLEALISKMNESIVDGKAIFPKDVSTRASDTGSVVNLSLHKMAYAVAAAQWLYEKRQDILVQFLQGIVDTRVL